jgi:hypothetical protein
MEQARAKQRELVMFQKFQRLPVALVHNCSQSQYYILKSLESYSDKCLGETICDHL